MKATEKEEEEVNTEGFRVEVRVWVMEETNNIIFDLKKIKFFFFNIFFISPLKKAKHYSKRKIN